MIIREGLRHEEYKFSSKSTPFLRSLTDIYIKLVTVGLETDLISVLDFTHETFK